MPRAVRRRMQAAVTFIREAEKVLQKRMPPEDVMLSRASAVLDIASDLATDIISPDDRCAKEIADGVAAYIAAQRTDGLRGDMSAIEAIADETSRSICTRQLALTDRVHLIAAVVRGVEEGLRSLLQGSAPRRVRDGPPPYRALALDAADQTGGEAHVDDKSPTRAPTNAGTELAARRSLTVRAAGPVPITPDYDNP